MAHVYQPCPASFALRCSKRPEHRTEGACNALSSRYSTTDGFFVAPVIRCPGRASFWEQPACQLARSSKVPFSDRIPVEVSSKVLGENADAARGQTYAAQSPGGDLLFEETTRATYAARCLSEPECDTFDGG